MTNPTYLDDLVETTVDDLKKKILKKFRSSVRSADPEQSDYAQDIRMIMEEELEEYSNEVN